MCELFGMTSGHDICINNYLKAFYARSEYHPHGWGLGLLKGNEADIDKEPLKASESRYLKERLEYPVIAETALAHIRYATVGNVEYINCHPFTMKDNCGRRWTQIHNGTMFECPELNEFIDTQTGSTDSERVLMYIVGRIDREQARLSRALTADERFGLLDEIICQITPSNKVNILIFDGEVMYAHTNYRGTLHYLEKDDCTVFSTQPLSYENWKPVPFMQLVGYRAGAFFREGTVHGNEYRDNAAEKKNLYQIFPEL